MKRERPDYDIFKLCTTGSLEDVQEAVRNGADVVSYQEETKGATSLILLIRRNAYKIITWLFENVQYMSILCKTMDNYGCSPLHHAVNFSSKEVVQVLISKGCLINHKSVNDNQTALHMCCYARERRYDIVAIAETLIKGGADIEAKDVNGCTPLLLACALGTEELVVYLLTMGANVHAQSVGGYSSLMYACMNSGDGYRMIPLLIQAGVKTDVADSGGCTVSDHCANGYILKELKNHVASLRLTSAFPALDNDPIGVYQEKLNRLDVSFSQALKLKRCPETCASMLLRNGSKFDTVAMITALSSSDDPKLWKYVAWETSQLIQPGTKDTLLHIAARKGDIEIIRTLFNERLNPYVCNQNGKQAIDEVKAEHKKMFEDYMKWRPDRLVHRWFGPIFMGRIWAFLLVCRRYNVQKDVRNVIISLVASMEYVWVKK